MVTMDDRVQSGGEKGQHFEEALHICVDDCLRAIPNRVDEPEQRVGRPADSERYCDGEKGYDCLPLRFEHVIRFLGEFFLARGGHGHLNCKWREKLRSLVEPCCSREQTAEPPVVLEWTTDRANVLEREFDGSYFLPANCLIGTRYGEH